MPKVAIYNQKGEQVREMQVSPAVLNVKMNEKVLHQVVVAIAANQRQVLAHTKDKSEVRGGGKKPWRQKGTGRARHGSIRSPLWIGGGVTFGPTSERNFSQKINKKMRQKAVLMALSDRFRAGALKVVDSFDGVKEIKTRVFKNILEKLNLKKSVLVVVKEFDEKMLMSLNNLPKVEAVRADSLNAQIILKYKNLLASEDAIKNIEDSVKKRAVKK
jgi:large subunit ribosomal protein L4